MINEKNRISDNDLEKVIGGISLWQQNLLYSHTDPNLENKNESDAPGPLPTEAYNNPQGFVDKGLVMRS